MLTKKNGSLKALILDSFTFGYLASVVLLVLSQPDESSLMELGRNTLIFSLLVAVGAVVAFILEKKGVVSLGNFIFELAHLKMLRTPKAWYRNFWLWQLLISFVVTLIVGFKLTDFSMYDLLDESGFQGAVRIFSALLSPEWSVLPRAVLAIIETIYIAFMATVMAIPVAFVLAFFAAKNIMGRTVGGLAIYFSLRTLLNVSRSIEPLIWAIIFSVWVGIGPFAGMLALFFHSISSLTKQYSEIIESADEGPIEGITATGANSIQVVWYAIVPQVILPYIAFTIYRWDINVRMATIIGLVGGGGIGTLLIQYQGQAMWHEVGTLALLIVVIVWSMDTVSAYLREALK